MPSKISYPADVEKLYANKLDKWYIESRFYWSTQEATVESMINGPDNSSTPDLKFSYTVLSLLKFEEKIHGGRIADCGGGIGRVAFQVLIHFFDKIDIIDPIPHFLFKAREYIEKDAPVETEQVGLEEWNPQKTYDAFWIQWTLCQLTDADVIAFLKKCKENSTDNAMVFVKENVAGHDFKAAKSEYEYNSEKNAIHRTYNHWIELFNTAGLILEEYRIQPDIPDNMLTVVLFVLRK